MDDQFLNTSDYNSTSAWLNTSLPTEEPTIQGGGDGRLSAGQLYACNLYTFVVTGIIQLIITIVGLAGKCTCETRQ